MKARHWICLASMLLLALPAPADESRTTYYAVFADGKKIGHATQTRKALADKITTTETTNMTMTRGEMSGTVRQSETSVETTDGKPLGFETVQQMATMVTTSKGTVTEDGKLIVSVEAMGQRQEHTMDWPQGALMTGGLRLLQRKKGLTQGTKYDLKVFVPSMLRALACKVTVGPTQMVDLLGRGFERRGLRRGLR